MTSNAYIDFAVFMSMEVASRTALAREGSGRTLRQRLGQSRLKTKRSGCAVQNTKEERVCMQTGVHGSTWRSEKDCAARSSGCGGRAWT